MRRSTGGARTANGGASRCAARSPSTSRRPWSMSAITRPMPSRAGPESGCRPRPSGRWSPAIARSAAISWNPPNYRADALRYPLKARRRPRQRRSSSGATYGNGRRAHSRPIPASARRRAPSANITASSWSTSSCCAAAPARRRWNRCAPVTAPSSTRIRRWQMRGLRLADDAGSKQTAGPRGTPAGSKAKTRDPQGGFAASILGGLGGAQKTIEAKWLYDAAGSALFDRITALDGVLPDADRDRHPCRCRPPPAGIRAARRRPCRTRQRLERSRPACCSTRCRISPPTCRSTSRRRIWGAAATKLEADYAALDIHPVVADFTRDFALPADYSAMPKLLFFPGSTIGNFEVAESVELMRRLRGLDNLSAFVRRLRPRQGPQGRCCAPMTTRTVSPRASTSIS